jgi:hypothetical protein
LIAAIARLAQQRGLVHLACAVVATMMAVAKAWLFVL